MKLLHSPLSPYARKARLVIRKRGLTARVSEEILNPRQEVEKIDGINPLGRVPALVLDDGSTLVDSPVIAGYLDALAPGTRLIPADGARHWQLRHLEAICDGVLDAALEIRAEILKPAEFHYQPMMDRRRHSMLHTLDVLERGDLRGDEFGYDTICLISMLGYLDFRFGDLAWRNGRPRLSALMARWANDPAAAETAPA